MREELFSNIFLGIFVYLPFTYLFLLTLIRLRNEPLDLKKKNKSLLYRILTFQIKRRFVIYPLFFIYLVFMSILHFFISSIGLNTGLLH